MSHPTITYWRHLVIGCLLLLLWPLSAGTQTTAAANSEVVVLELTGPIGPASGDYFHRALEEATQGGAAVVILRMDTPGGLDSSMRDIIKDILASPIPIVSYVSPSGARAASAGTYILYASHVAAMAPATNLGAATPVQIGGPGMPSPGEPDSPMPGGPGKQPGSPEQAPADKAPGDDAMKRKMVNDAVAYIRGLAKLRGRNAEWAEQAVREAASLSAGAALQAGVIDIVATDIGDLLRQLHGRTVRVLGEERVLNTENAVIRTIQPDWRSRLLAVITNPNVAYILMLLGIYGLIFEFSNPGSIVPGVTGAIALLLALFALQVLPVNYTGLALILLGIALMIAEAFAPSFGALGIGGLVAFVFGSIILMETDMPGFQIALPLIAIFALASLGMFTVIIGMAIRTRRKPVVSGQEELVGGIAEVIEDFDESGTVRIHSENWRACTRTPLQRGQRVRVIRMDGLTLWVEPETQTGTEEDTQ